MLNIISGPDFSIKYDKGNSNVIAKFPDNTVQSATIKPEGWHHVMMSYNPRTRFAHVSKFVRRRHRQINKALRILRMEYTGEFTVQASFKLTDECDMNGDVIVFRNY